MCGCLVAVQHVADDDEGATRGEDAPDDHDPGESDDREVGAVVNPHCAGDDERGDEQADDDAIGNAVHAADEPLLVVDMHAHRDAVVGQVEQALRLRGERARS